MNRKLFENKVSAFHNMMKSSVMMQQRKTNFTQRELNMLLCSVAKRRRTILSGMSAGQDRWAAAWREVAREVSGIEGIQRTDADVRKKWTYLKWEAKNTSKPFTDSMSQAVLKILTNGNSQNSSLFTNILNAAQPEPTPVPSTSGVANTATSSVPSQPHVKPYVPVQVDVRAKPHVPVPSDLRPTLTPAVAKKSPTTPELDSLPPPSLENDSSISVKWNTYATNMSSVMPSLLEDEKFVDVTLACDGKYIKCHKVILGACSPYFEELLYVNPCQHPIILMKDFQFWEIRAVVDFIYRGVVNIPQHLLPKLLQVANVLQIKGLTGTRNENESEEDVRLADHSRDSQSQVGNKLRKRSELSPTEQTSRSKTSPSPAKKMKIISTSSSRHSFESHTSDESSNQSDVSQSTSSAVAVSLEPSTLLHSVCIKEETNYGVDDPPDCTYTSDQNEDKGNFSQLGQFQQLTLPGSRTIKQEVNEDMMEATDQDPLDLESGVS